MGTAPPPRVVVEAAIHVDPFAAAESQGDQVHGLRLNAATRTGRGLRCLRDETTAGGEDGSDEDGFQNRGSDQN